MTKFAYHKEEDIRPGQVQFFARVTREELNKAGIRIPKWEGNVFYLDRENYKIYLEQLQKTEANNAKKNIDPTTKFMVGSREYDEYYYPKIDKSGRHK